MQYTEQRPSHPALRSIVRCFWHLRADASFAIGPTQRPEPVLPDGCVELILNFADPFVRVEVDGSRTTQSRTLFVGEIHTSLCSGPTGRVDLIGIRIEPGALRRVIGTPAHKVIQCRSFDEFSAPRLRESLLAALAIENVPVRIARIEEALLQSLAPSMSEDLLATRVAAALRTQVEQGAASIDAIANRMGVSTRHVERAFHSCVGVPPKTFAKIVRFRRALERAPTATSLLSLAAECGYADQSHLTRDFRRFAGMPPSAFLTRNGSIADAFIE